MDKRYVPPDRPQGNAHHGEEQIQGEPENVARSSRIDRDVVWHPVVGARGLHQIIGDPSHASATLSRRSDEKATAPSSRTKLRRISWSALTRRLVDGCACDHWCSGDRSHFETLH
jgi:hypothetical protein